MKLRYMLILFAPLAITCYRADVVSLNPVAAMASEQSASCLGLKSILAKDRGEDKMYCTARGCWWPLGAQACSASWDADGASDLHSSRRSFPEAHSRFTFTSCSWHTLILATDKLEKEFYLPLVAIHF